MAQRDLTMPLVMATTPSDPLPRRAHYRKPRSRLNHYNFLWFIHKVMVLACIALLSIASYKLISNFLFRSVRVVGTSMTPTLAEGNQYLLDRWAFRNRDPQHNEIVVIRDPGDHGLSVKRVIAVGGESVLFKDGCVFVNGKKLDEPFLPPRTRTFTYTRIHEQFIMCGQDQYFVLGDNRLRSIDSRAYGPVSRSDILGLVKVD